MTDPCHVCDTPDGDHLDWCTPQAREQRPSKDLLAKLRSYHPTSGYARFMRQAADEIERLQVIEKLYKEQCDAGYARGSAAESPVARCEHGNPIDPTGGYVCLKCFRAAQPPGDG